MSKHVHIHLGRKTAERQAAQRTADADSEGKWVTINGAHVQIGAGGKITKGPKELVGKLRHEAHQDAGAEHLKKHDEAKAKGDNEQAKKHLDASAAHTNAGQHFKVGNHELGESVAKDAEKHHASTQTVHTAKPKPKAHQQLHDEAGAAIAARGSKKHKDEHEKLMKSYESSTANWERDATNRMISKNVVASNQAHAAGVEQKAREASAAAHKDGSPAAHQKAAEALKNASTAHGKAGGPGYAKKQEELDAIRKGHESAGKASAAESFDHKAKADFHAFESKSATANEYHKQLHGMAAKAHKEAHFAKGTTDFPAKQKAAHKATRTAETGNIDGSHKDVPGKKPSHMEKQAAAAAGRGKQGEVGVKQSITQQAHNDAAAGHRAKAKNWSNPAHGQHEEGGKEVAAMHEAAAAHHEHMASNPNEDHTERGKQLQSLKHAIGEAESKVQSGKGHEVSKKAKTGGGKSSASSSQKVQQATDAVKSLKKGMKKAEEQADPDPRKKD